MAAEPGVPAPPSHALDDELLEVGGSWYVRTGSALADDRTRILKDNDTFAVLNRYGDVQSIGLGEQGLYHLGTRHLSHFDLRIAHKRPLFLGAALSDDNAVLTVDLANPEFTSDDGEVVPAETIHLLRTLLLSNGALHERVEVRNYGRRPVRCTLNHHFESDFRDIFEVRGLRREQRGLLHPVAWSAGSAALVYDGLDELRRTTYVSWTGSPDPVGPNLDTQIELAPGMSALTDLRVQCHTGDAPRAVVEFEDARMALQVRRRDTLRAGCQIETSNDAFNAWLAHSRADLAMLRTETPLGAYPYAGIPWFSTPFGRDGLITALETLWCMPQLTAAVLRFLASTQAEEFDAASDAAPGKILHEARGGELAALGEIPFARYYGSADATPLFVMLAGAYFEATGDRALLKTLWPHVRRALDWIAGAGDGDSDGLVTYSANYEALVHQGWKDSHDSVFHADGSEPVGPIALVEVQAYVYAAKQAGARLAREFADPMTAGRLQAEAEALRERFRSTFWLDHLGTYAIAIDGTKQPCAVRTSNAGHALFTGVAGADEAARVAASLLSDEHFSGWGVRTLAVGEPRYNPMSYHNGSVWPHDNAIIADGLARYGHKAEVLRIFNALFDASQALEQWLPELVCGFPRNAPTPIRYPVANSPQAWAAGSVFMLLRAALGLHIDAAKGLVRLDQPVLPAWLDRVRITALAVGDDEVDLDIRRSTDGIHVAVTRCTGAVEVVTRSK